MKRTNLSESTTKCYNEGKGTKINLARAEILFRRLHLLKQFGDQSNFDTGIKFLEKYVLVGYSNSSKCFSIIFIESSI
jgi:hypothetical protein